MMYVRGKDKEEEMSCNYEFVILTSLNLSDV